MTARHTKRWVLGACITLIGCAGDPPGSAIGEPVKTGGPMVVFDLLDKPLPSIPLPNDVATRFDESSPSGRYINVSQVAPTFLESDTRAKANTLDGFGTFMPISVSFSAPLDLVDLHARHGSNDDPTDDAVYLVDVDPASPEFGKRWPLDIGTGNFPIALEKRNNYFDNDGHRFSSNIVLDVRDEDLNGNNILDAGEDTDWDGTLDRPNWIDQTAVAADFIPEGMTASTLLCTEGGDQDGGLENITAGEMIHYDNLADFYERETNTLIMRPVLPLRALTQYAVVLTTRLKGEAGKAVQSPWPGKQHASQEKALSGLGGVLGGLGLTESDVAFAWTYTTGSNTRELEWIRAGMYGHGKMAWIADEYPTDQMALDVVTTVPEFPYYAGLEQFGAILPLLAGELGGSPEQQNSLSKDIQNIGGIVMGTFESPSFLIDRDGIATEGYPANDDEVFEIDPVTGSAVHGPETVTWWCALPKRDTEMHGDKPFKTVLYGHGYTSQRLEILAFAGRATRFGLAICTVDAFGHGLTLSKSEQELVDQLSTLAPQLAPLVDGINKGRSRDLDNDGRPDSGGDFWTADIFHTRDVVRQSIVDHMRFIQILRTFDGEKTWVFDTDGDGAGNLAGDFDGDGLIDIGGPVDNYYMWGQSLGGILAGVMAGIEPTLIAAAPTAGGAGLMDIGVRSRQGGVPEAVFLPLMGPFVVANPADGGGIGLQWLVNNVNNASRHAFGTLEDVVPADRVEVTNLNNGESNFAVVPNDLRFRIPIPSDALTASERRPVLGLNDEGVEAPVEFADTTKLGDPIEIRVFSGGDGSLKSTLTTFEIPVTFQGTVYPEGAPLVAISKGLGLLRNAPSLRRMMGISQMILESADPVSFAPHYDKPLDFSYDPTAVPGCNVLNIPTAGDMNVPVNTGIQISRAAGLIELEAANPRYDGTALEGMSDNRVLISTYSVEAVECLPRWRNAEGTPVLFDPDDLSDGTTAWGLPTLRSEFGVEPLRLTQTATHPQGGVHGMRMPMVERRGKHGFEPAKPSEPFDTNNYMNNLVNYYFWMDGTDIPDHPCLQDSTCNTAGEGAPSLPFEALAWELDGEE
jgi:hypothetical protein